VLPQKIFYVFLVVAKEDVMGGKQLCRSPLLAATRRAATQLSDRQWSSQPWGVQTPFAFVGGQWTLRHTVMDCDMERNHNIEK